MSCLSFALIPYLETNAFIFVGFFSRFIQGVGGSGVATSVVAIISTKYRDNVGKLFGIQQTLTGVSMIIGPVLGGILY